MDLGWLPIVALLIGLYFFFLMAYRLWIAGKALVAAAGRTAGLLAELQRYDRLVPEGKQAITASELDRVILERKKLVNRRRKAKQERERRLVNRVREIEIDKRWA
jgi:hypothetical protein